MNITIIGGGIIGLCTAYYLNKDGHSVSLIDDGVIETGTSHGNMGYLCYSHIVPLANPHKLSAGLRSLFQSDSPFYIRPSLDPALVKWLVKFLFACRPNAQKPRIEGLHQLNTLSVNEFMELEREFGGAFTIHKNGFFALTARNDKLGDFDHEHALNLQYNVDSQRVSKKEIQDIDANFHSTAVGGLYHADDCHINASEFMAAMKTRLLNAGVDIVENTPVEALNAGKDTVDSLQTAKHAFKSDCYVITAGSWSTTLLNKVGQKLCMVPAKGYSVTIPAKKNTFKTPFVITEKSVAATPLGDMVRFGSTLEIGGHDNRVHAKRSRAIVNAIKAFMPDYPIGDRTPSEFWYGYRPCSFDGLPFLGRSHAYKNLFLATGHGMLGVTQAPGSAKIIAELIAGKKPSLNVKPYDPNR